MFKIILSPALFAAALLAGAAIRLCGRRGGKLVGLDVWDYLLTAKAIKENGMRVPKENPYHAIKNPFDTPPFFYFLVALLPSGNLEVYSKYLSVAFDWLNASIIAAITFFVSGSVDAGLLAGALFMFTPSSTVESLAFNVRSFAALVFTIFVAVLALYSQTLSLTWLCAAAALFALIAMTHKFTVQAAVIVLVGLALAFWNAGFILIALLGATFAWLSFGKRYEAVLRGHAAILDFWRCNISERGLRKLAGSLMKVAVNPWLIFAFIPMLVGAAWAGVNAFFFVVVASLVAAFVLTSFKPLAFLGENHRYLEYASLPAFALAAQYLVFNVGIFASSLVLACIVLSWLVITRFEAALLNSSEFTQTPAFVEACHAVARSKCNVVLCVPDFNTPCAFFSGKKTFTATSPTLWKANPWLVFRERLSLREAIKCGVDMILVSRAEETEVTRKLASAGVEKIQFFRNAEFAAFEVGEAKPK